MYVSKSGRDIAKPASRERVLTSILVQLWLLYAVATQRSATKQQLVAQKTVMATMLRTLNHSSRVLRTLNSENFKLLMWVLAMN